MIPWRVQSQAGERNLAHQLREELCVCLSFVLSVCVSNQGTKFHLLLLLLIVSRDKVNISVQSKHLHFPGNNIEHCVTPEGRATATA